jgi:hypothetical protein
MPLKEDRGLVDVKCKMQSNLAILSARRYDNVTVRRIARNSDGLS